MKLRRVLRTVSSILNDPSLNKYARIIPFTFHRKIGKIPLHLLLTYLIFRHGRTLSEDICTIYPALNNLNPPSKQAVLKRLSILNYDVWYQIHRLFLERIYIPEKKKTYHGYLLIAVDGTFASLPHNEALDHIFGKRECYKKGAAAECNSPPQAKISVAYDVLNHVILDFRIASVNTSEIPLLFEHLKALEPLLKKYKVILLADRYYGSAELFKYCEMKGYKYLVRAKKNFFKKQRKQIPEDKMDDNFVVVIDKLWQKRIIHEQIRRYISIYPVMHVRLVKGKYEYDSEEITLNREKRITHCSVEAEYFTNLSAAEFDKEEIIRLYHYNRWDIETNYGTMKGIINIEQLNSANPIVVMNEMMADIIYANIENIVRNESDNQIPEEEQAIHLVNNKHVIEMCRSSWFVRAVYTGKMSVEKLQDLVKECARVKIMIREGRHYRRWRKFRNTLTQNRHRIDGRNDPPLAKIKTGFVTTNH